MLLKPDEAMYERVQYEQRWVHSLIQRYIGELFSRTAYDRHSADAALDGWYKMDCAATHARTVPLQSDVAMYRKT